MDIVSIITPLYKGKKYIPVLLDAIEACAKCADKVATVEWIISNDDPDEKIDWINTNTGLKIKIIDTDINRGIQGARVRGLNESCGEFVLFLDQDDYIRPEWIKSQLQNIGDADICVCDCSIFGKPFYNTPWRPSLSECITKEYNIRVRHGFIPGQALIKRSSIPELWKNKWLTYNCCDDYYLWLCMYADKIDIVYNPRNLYEHRYSGFNQSDDLYIWIKSTYEMLDIIRENNLFSEDDYNLLVNARENEIKKILDETRWIGIRHRFFQTLLMYNEDKNIFSHLFTEGDVVAIYGVKLGKWLYYILNDMKVKVRCFLDKSDDEDMPVPTYRKEELPTDVNTVIITMLKRENIEQAANYLNKENPGVRIMDIASFCK